MVREYKGAYSGEHGDGLCARRVGGVAVRPAPHAARSPRSRRCSIRTACMNPGKIVAPAADGRCDAVPLRPGYRTRPFEPRSTESAWDVIATRDGTYRARSGGDPATVSPGAIEMCNNNGHCRKFDAGTMCPSFRVTAR